MALSRAGRPGRTGVSAGYSFLDGWYAPYPETTGYIIPTFYDYAHSTRKEEYSSARLMADWEIEVQLPCGGVQGGHYVGPTADRRPVAFNTGQVILGWVRAYTETADEKYLDAAGRAGDWLISAQSTDGAWRLDSPIRSYECSRLRRSNSLEPARTRRPVERRAVRRSRSSQPRMDAGPTTRERLVQEQ